MIRRRRRQRRAMEAQANGEEFAIQRESDSTDEFDEKHDIEEGMMSSDIDDIDIGHLVTSGDDVIEGRKYPQTAQRDHSDTEVAPQSPIIKGPSKLAKTQGAGFKPRKKPDIHLNLNLVKET
jgi:hypothetical protein